MPLQGEYAPSSAQWVRDQVEEIESSGGERGTVLRGVPVIVITSMGSGSGKLRKNPVMRVEHHGFYAAVASKGGAPQNPSWYRNLIEHPLVELQDGRLRVHLAELDHLDDVSIHLHLADDGPNRLVRRRLAPDGDPAGLVIALDLERGIDAY